MLDMICSFPSPCGNEEILKRYIIKKYPYDWEEDNIGNLILHKANGSEKLMLYVSIDEDGFLVVENTEGKVYFSHIGDKKVFPGTCISFGGYKGVVLSDNKENPEKEQYIKTVSECEISQGQNGVADLEYYEDEGVAFTKEAANRLVLDAILDLSLVETKYDLYIVLGVQSKNLYKGIKNAVNSIKPDKVIAFEQTTQKKMSYRVTAKNFMINPECKNYLEEISQKAELTFEPEINNKVNSVAGFVECPYTLVFGIPVEFPDDLRQAVKTEYKDKVQKLLKTIIL